MVGTWYLLRYLAYFAFLFIYLFTFQNKDKSVKETLYLHKKNIFYFIKKWQQFPTKATLELKFDRIIIFLEPRQIYFMWDVCLKIFAD